jgi:transcriptional regulator with XRE-family HTH domain
MQQSKKRRRKLSRELQTLKDAGWTVYMPRKWKQGEKNKWLPKLRRVIKKSQVQFAAMIGEDPKVIINIENGRRRLDGNVANKILFATGADAGVYYIGKTNRLQAVEGGNYTHETFVNWRENYSGTDQKSLNDFFEKASDSLHLILRAAIKCGSPKNHLPALKRSFMDWCLDSVKNFQLKSSLDAIILEERKGIRAGDFFGF